MFEIYMLVALISVLFWYTEFVSFPSQAGRKYIFSTFNSGCFIPYWE
ncbi:MAG: hypothetical protein RSE57_07040 [Clostridia bacterium]